MIRLLQSIALALSAAFTRVGVPAPRPPTPIEEEDWSKWIETEGDIDFEFMAKRNGPRILTPEERERWNNLSARMIAEQNERVAVEVTKRYYDYREKLKRPVQVLVTMPREEALKLVREKKAEWVA